jgi:hypothetical protein
MYGTPDMSFVEYSFKAYTLLFKKITLDLIGSLNTKKTKIDSSKTWVISNTLNNNKSTSYLRKHIKQVQFLQINRKNNNNDTLRIGFYPENIFKLIRFLILTDEKWYRYNPHFLYDVFNFNDTLISLFKVNKPKAIIFSNDHYFLNRMLLNESRKHKITSIYIAHASVSNYFPPLEFDHSFLFGQSMLEIYKRIGVIKGNTYLVGNSRSDDLIDLRKESRDRNIIGIGINPLDDLNLVKITIEKLLERYKNINIVIRFHPRIKTYKIINSRRVIYTSSQNEDLKTFLRRISVLICGNSGLILDAAISGVRSIQFHHEINPMEDNYGFIKNEIAKLCSNYYELFEIINDFHSLEYLKKTKYFEESIGSNYEGNVKKKIGQKIYKIIYE